MRSTFSRYFFPAAITLLAALLLVGASFRALVKDFLNDHAIEGLYNNANAISALASAYYTEGSLSDRDFLVNLSVASQVSGADAVICDAEGRLVLCSDAPFGCETHQGLRISTESFLRQVLTQGSYQGAGVIRRLYSDARYFVAVAIRDASTSVPVGLSLIHI